MVVLDYYFKRPVIWDYITGLLVSSVAFRGFERGLIALSKEDIYTATTSDISNVSLTSTGFILTLLTVLITFKSGSTVTKEEVTEQTPLFNIFFASSLYFETVRHLKNCIKSLIFIAILGYSLKLCLTDHYRYYLYFYNILGLIIIVATLFRCLLILSKILEMQSENKK